MMNADKIIENAISYIEELFRGNFGGHDAAHTMRVYRNAMRLADQEPSCDREIIALAALLHDADDHKLFQTEDNQNARVFLNENQISAEKQERILQAIRSVSFSQNKGKTPETIEGKIVQDADRLDAMGAIGIARTFAYGGEHGRPMSESLKHFQDKLLRLKSSMNTEAGAKLAERRHEFLEEFLKEWEEEEAET